MICSLTVNDENQFIRLWWPKESVAALLRRAIILSILIVRHCSQTEDIVEEDTLVLRRSFVYMVLIPVAFIAGLATGYLFWGRANQGQNPPIAESLPTALGTTATGEQQRFDVPVDDDPFLGPADAPVVIIEFSDFSCGYCRKWYNETLCILGLPQRPFLGRGSPRPLRLHQIR
jgi:hypothetical protein